MDTKRLLGRISEHKFNMSIDKINIFEYDEFKKIYMEMKKEYERILKEMDEKKNEWKVDVTPIEKESLHRELKDASFLSKEVGDYIKKNFHYKIHIQFEEVEMVYYSKTSKLSKKEMQDIKKIIILIFLFKDTYDRDHFRQKVIYYPTPLKKMMPIQKHQCLGRNECNSGLTYVNSHSDPNHIDNGDIIIFRKEEHCKVFIHEMIHSNFRDLMLIRHSENREFTKRFCTDYDILLNESYTEFNATILNIFYLGIIHHLNEKKINELLRKEIKYGIYVCKRIMNYFDIERVNQIIKKNEFCEKKLHQKTNVISYYFFKPLQMLHLKEMNEFLKKHTEKIQIHSKEGVHLYREMILNWLEEHDLEEKMIMTTSKKKIEPERSLRMTLFESCI